MIKNAASIKALTFDVFGTVVDWRSSIIMECEALGGRKGVTRDWARFADEWRGGYAPAMDLVRKGGLPWTNIDSLHRMVLDRLLSEFEIGGLTEKEKDHLNRAWHRLGPWPDSIRGIERLRTRYVVATLSNGNVSLLVDMAKNAGLAWDCVLSSELAGHYKPDREVYLTAASLLGLEPGQVMMAAAHRDDLEAARSFGLRTAFISRPLEFGPEGKPDTASGGDFDIVAEDIIDLAEKLGA
ncbi:MAG TPA: haloacid dehalogenase type II [Thermodesulfobacteriota bacterium]|nr:haloacid dehalogenase type II [Thermodesulfobacteriota bacterium]